MKTPPSPFILTHDRILCESVPDDQKQLLVKLADPSKDERYCLVVVAVGPGRMTENGTISKPCVKVGDKVVLMPRRGSGLELHGHSYVACENADILGVVDDAVMKELEDGKNDFLAQLAQPISKIFGAG